jgi:lipopolysaccharide export system protein LptC
VSLRRIFGLTLLLTAAFGSWYLSQSLSQRAASHATADADHDGFYLRAAKVLGTDDNGALLYRIEAEYAEQRSPSEIEFQNVNIHYASVSDVPWTLVADHASIGEDQKRVTLRFARNTLNLSLIPTSRGPKTGCRSALERAASRQPAC